MTTPRLWVDPSPPERPWRTPRAHDASPATYRFLLTVVVLLVLVTALWSSGALGERDDAESFRPAGALLSMGAFEARFTEGVVERRSDGSWELRGYGTITGLGAETSYAPKAVVALQDQSVFFDGATQVGRDFGTAVQPGLTSDLEVTVKLPPQWQPVDTVCLGFRQQTQQKARLGDDGKTWVSESKWACSWVPVIRAGS